MLGRGPNRAKGTLTANISGKKWFNDLFDSPKCHGGLLDMHMANQRIAGTEVQLIT